MPQKSAVASFAPREVSGRPSVPRTARLKERYLEAPLMVDLEYIKLLTESHRRTDGIETLQRRAEDHAYAVQHLTPVIHPEERIVANKTRFIRGAVPYAQLRRGSLPQRDPATGAGRPAEERGTGRGGRHRKSAPRGHREGIPGPLWEIPGLTRGLRRVQGSLRVLGRQVPDGGGRPAVEGGVPRRPFHRGRVDDEPLHGAPRSVPGRPDGPRLRDRARQGLRGI